MKEAVGNIWDHPVRIITTNGVVTARGTAVMGAGIAKQAADRYPELPALLGSRLQEYGNYAYYFEVGGIITMPTKHNWRDPSDIELIVSSAHRISRMVDYLEFTHVVSPRPGCGLGQLSWSQVKPLLSEIWDDRFTILNPK